MKRAAFSLVVGIAMFIFFGHTHHALAAAPTDFTSQTFTDVNNDGEVDTVTVVINGGEALDACVVTAGELTTDWTYAGGTAIHGSIASATCDLPSATITFTLTGVTGGVTGAYPGATVLPTIAYDNDDGDASISNTSGDLGTVAATTLTDQAKPFIYSAQTHDNDGNGLIDRITYLWTESIDTDDGSAPVAGDMPTTILPDGSTANFSSAVISDPAGASFSITATGVTGQITVNTGVGSSAVSGDLSAKWKDAAAIPNAADAVFGTGNASEEDQAAPVFVSVSPASGATGASRTGDIVIVFSEPMVTSFVYATEFTASPNPGGWAAAFSNSNKTVTLSHSAFGCSAAITITTVEAEINAAAGGSTTVVTTGPQDGDWSFTASGCGSSTGGGSSTPKTYSIDLLTPTGNETLTAGQLLDLTWTTAGTGTTPFVNLSYTADNGISWNVITDNTTNDGLYSWLITSLPLGTSIIVKATGTDLSAVLATDTSPSVTVGIVPAPPTPEPTPIPVEPTTTPTTSGFGPSPATGLTEPISQVTIGQYIKSSSFPTVYYLDPNGTRRPFLNEQVYFTWASSFSQIVIVTDATLPTIPLGTPVIPRPRVVLVKIISDSRVYAVESADATSTVGVLRLIPSEIIAVSVYGADWSDFVMDISSTLISRYTHGADITTSDIRPAGMKKRSALHG